MRPMPDQLDGAPVAAEPTGVPGETSLDPRSGALVAVAAVVAAGLVVLSVFAGAWVAGLAVAVAGLVLGWGWPDVLDLPSPRGTSGVLGATALALGAVAAATTDDPLLRWVPAVVAGGVLLTFIHQLARRDGRPRLVATVAGTLTGIALLAAGTGFVGLARVHHGATVAAVALVGVAVGPVLDRACGPGGVRAWLLPLELGLGAGLAVLLGWWLGLPWGLAMLLGVVCTGLAHALRRVLVPLPSLASARPQLTTGVAVVLLVGVVAYLVCRTLVG